MAANNFSVHRSTDSVDESKFNLQRPASLSIPEDKQMEVPSPSNAVIQSLPKFVIVCAKKLDKDSVDKLEHLGKTILYDAKHYSQVPIDDIKFDYMIVTLNEDSRDWITHNIVDNEKYYTIAISDVYEQWIKDIKADNSIKKLPQSQIKPVFDKQLLTNHISLPSNKFKLLFKKVLLYLIGLCQSELSFSKQ